MVTLKRALLAGALVATAGLVHAAPPPGRAIEPKADQMLKQMTDYLAKLQTFELRSSAIDEVVTNTGQKLQVASESKVTVERPNRLRSEQMGAAQGLSFLYDGKTMTLACKANNSYATAPAPPTLDAAIDQARKQFRIEAPGADLLYSRPYEILTEQVTSGKFIGRETINGTPANHLAFEGEDVDWQIWIQEGPQPVPVRFVIVSKKVKGQPEFAVELSDWKTQASVDDTTFQFQPPQGAKRVQVAERGQPIGSLAASCGT
jgi:hypothetical protein